MPDAAQVESARQAKRKRARPAEPEAKAKSDEAREKLGVINPFSRKWLPDKAQVDPTRYSPAKRA